MTIRVKVRILLLVSVSLTVFYIISHVYRLNTWFTEKSVVLKQGKENTGFEQDEASAIDSASDYIQFNATKNVIKPISDHAKTQTFQSSNDDILTEHKFNNRSGYVESPQAKYTGLQPQDRDVHSKYVRNKATVQNSEKKSNDKLWPEKGSPSSNFDVLSRMTSKSFPTERAGKVTRPDKAIISVSTTTDIPAIDEYESGDVEEAKSRNSDANVGSENLNEDEDEAVMQKEDENPPAPEILLTPITPILSPSFSSKLHFKRNNSMEINTPKVIPLSTKKGTPEQSCVESESINETQYAVKSECDLYSNHLNTCTESVKYYTKESLSKPMNCSEPKHSPICYFINSTRTDNVSNLHLKCNYNACHKNEVRVGILNVTSGMISYIVLNSLRTVVTTLEEDAEFDDKEHRVDFIFLSCKMKNSKKNIHQILPFPPLVLRAKIEKKNLVEKEKEATKINVNIVVLDSLSRKHFYRTLSKTVDVMRSINNDKKGPSMVLDFKGFQSLAPFTYVNLQALLTGRVDYDSSAHISSRRYNFEDLFGVFEKSGYQTLLQEDTCWHDEWGSILSGNRRLEQTPLNLKKIWDEIRNLTKGYGIDSFGLTHMSCDVLASYGATNLFNSEDFVCFNGKPLSAYFLEHVLDNLSARKLTSKDMPLLSYTHINIAHESSGTRIVSMDQHLANFLSVLANSSDTFTILLSDHGGKTTDYSRDTLAGRFEVYDPFLFMVIPKQLADTVGESNMKNLIANQNSLLDLIDIRSMLLTLNNILKDKTVANSHSLLTKSIKYRTDCEHISIRNYGLCKCFSNVTFPNKKDDRYKEFLKWLSEFAVGHLNNILAEQQPHTRIGHKCHRIRANNKGNTIGNVVERHSLRGVVYLFDISTKFDNDIEVFNFQVLFDEKRNKNRDLLTVEHWMRVSIYSRYASCRDKDVSHELCMCSDTKREKITKKYLNHYKQFSISTANSLIDNSTCAYLLRRTNLYVVSFEVANMCVKKIHIQFSTPIMYSWASSHNLPVEVTVKPHTIHFLVTFIKIVDFNEEIKPMIVIIK